MEKAPKFLVDWEPRWHGFWSSVGPAFSRSLDPLSIECARAAGTPRSFGASVAVHIVGVIGIIAIWPLLSATARVPLELRSIDDYEVVYYRAEELPIVGDQAGAREGVSGVSGGREAYHPTQVIRVARGETPSSLVSSVPPTMKLQLSTKDLANLLVLARALPEGPKAPVEPPKPEPLKVQTMTAQNKLTAPKPIAAPGFQQFSRTMDRDPKLVLPTSPNVKLTPTVGTETAQVTGALSTVETHQRTPNAEFHTSAESLVARGGGGDSENGADGDAIETAIVMSVRPGNTLGAPGVDVNGAFTASPNGRSEIGIGSGGSTGNGSGSGSGPGAGNTGTGPGSGTTGTGKGSDPKAVAGIAPGTGGGAGTGPAGAPRSGAGVSISGGSGGGNGTIVMMPSFGSKAAPTMAPRGGKNVGGGPAIIIVAAPRAGGGLSRYGELKGGKVYTTYLQTSLGTAILQYADPTTKEGDEGEDLTPPQPVKTEVPEGMSVGRLVISCVLTKTGVLQNPKVLEGPQPEMSGKVLETLAAWRFRPVLRGNQKVDVNVLLGFKIDTR